MSTVYLCDRCGAEIKPGFINFLTRRSFLVRMRQRIPVMEQTAELDTELYICSNCEKSFIKWFANSGRRDGVST